MLNRPTLARAFVAMLLIAAAPGAGSVGREGTSSADAPRNHAVYSGISLSRSIAPRRVTLTRLSAERIGVATTVVTAAPGSVTDLRIPLTALIYDPQGLPWTYVAVGPDTYERVAVKVDRIDGDYALVAAGPRAGTPVVAVGAPELLGVEYGVGEE